MAKVHSKQSRVLFGDNHVSGDITGWSIEHRRQMSEVTNLLSTGEQFIPGIYGGRVSLRGLFDSAVGGLLEEADQVYATNDGMLVTILPEGLTIGTLCFIARGTIESRSITSAVKDAVAMQVEGQPNDGVDFGVCLHGLTAETANGQTSSVDNTNATANGGVGALHVTAFTGFTSVTVRVQHSVDNSAWVDLFSFNAVTGETYQRIRTVAGSTVNRYLRAQWAVTGVGSITFAVAFARR